MFSCFKTVSSSHKITAFAEQCKQPRRKMAGSAKKAVEALAYIGKVILSWETAAEYDKLKTSAEHRARRLAEAEHKAQNLPQRPASPSGKPTDFFSGSPDELFVSDNIFNTVFSFDYICTIFCLILIIYSLASVVAAFQLSKNSEIHKEKSYDLYKKSIHNALLNFLLVGGGIFSNVLTSSLKEWAEKKDEAMNLDTALHKYSSWLTYAIDSEWFFLIIVAITLFFVTLLHRLVKKII